MSLLWPPGLAAMAIVPLMWWLHRRRAQARRHVVPSLVPWMALPGEPPRRRMRVPPSVPLVLRLLAAALFALALAQPTVPGARGAPDARVIVLDTSSSMAAGTRWPEAVQRARSVLAGGGRTALITAGPEPELVWRDGPGLGAALDGLHPGGTGSAIDEALALADAVHPGGGILVLGDAGTPDPSTDARTARIERFGVPLDNVALLEARAYRAKDAAAGSQLFARIAAFTADTVETTWIVSEDGVDVARQRVRLEPGNTQDLTWRLDPGTSVVRLRRDGADGLRLDDEAILDVRPRALRLQWTGRSEGVARSLDAIPSLAALNVGRAQLVDDASMDVTLIVGPVPDPLPRGATLLINPPAGEWLALAAEAKVVSMGAVYAAEPLDDMDWSGVRVGGARAESAPAGAQTLLATADRLLVWETETLHGTVAVLAFDPDEGNLARHATLPILISRMLEHLARLPEASRTSGSLLSAPARWRGETLVRGPDGQPRSPRLGRWRLDEPGVWTLSPPTELDRGQPLSVFVLGGDARESDLRGSPPASRANDQPKDDAPGQLPLAPGLAILACILVAAESFVTMPRLARAQSGRRRLRPQAR